jgi:hypothetical protein
MASLTIEQAVGNIETLQNQLDKLLAVNTATNIAINNLTVFLREAVVQPTILTAHNGKDDKSPAVSGAYSFYPAELSLDELPIQNFPGARYESIKLEWTSEPHDHLLFDRHSLVLKVLWEEYDFTSPDHGL